MWEGGCCDDWGFEVLVLIRGTGWRGTGWRGFWVGS